MATVRRCLFCNSVLSGGRSREHVFPEWLLEELDIGQAAVQPTQLRPDGTVVSKRSHELEQLQEGRICTGCNTGWMSRLEVAARPLLRPLFRGARLVTDFSPRQRAILARWTVKTAFVLNSASNFDQKIAARHFHELFENLTPVPAGVHVFAQAQDGQQDFYWMQGALWHTFAKPELNDDPTSLQKDSYKVTLLFRKLLLQVAYWPAPGWQLVIWAGVHIPLWPIRGPIAHYQDADPFPKNNAARSVARFHASLKVIKVPPGSAPRRGKERQKRRR